MIKNLALSRRFSATSLDKKSSKFSFDYFTTSLCWLIEYAIVVREIHRTPNLGRKDASTELLSILTKELSTKSIQKSITKNNKSKFFTELAKINIQLESIVFASNDLTQSDIDNTWIKYVHHQVIENTSLIDKSINASAKTHFHHACSAMTDDNTTCQHIEIEVALTPVLVLLKGLELNNQHMYVKLIEWYFHLSYLTIQASDSDDYKYSLISGDTVLDSDNKSYYGPLFAPILKIILQLNESGNMGVDYKLCSKMIIKIFETGHFKTVTCPQPIIMPSLGEIDYSFLKHIQPFADLVMKSFPTWQISRSHKGPEMPSFHRERLCDLFKHCFDISIQTQLPDWTSAYEEMHGFCSINQTKETIDCETTCKSYQLLLKLDLLKHFINIEPQITVEYVGQVMKCMDSVFIKADADLNERHSNTKTKCDDVVRTPAHPVIILMKKEQASPTEGLSKNLSELSIVNLNAKSLNHDF